MKWLIGFALILEISSANAQNCNLTLENAHVWDGSKYVQQSLSIKDGYFVTSDSALPKVDAGPLYFIPPFADGHTHALDAPSVNDTRHAKAIAQGVFYAFNPNNIRPKGQTPAALPDQVEIQAAGAGVTRPGGHPQPTYTYLAERGWLGPLKVADLPGRAFHTATSIDEVKAAVASVKANGASVIKLYLLDHDKPYSKGLSGPLFDAAVSHAKQLKLRPIVHIENAADFRRAVTSRVYAIMHMPYALSDGRLPAEMMITAADAKAAADAGIFIVPTVTVSLTNNDGAQLRSIQDVQRHNLVLMNKAGVRMAVGADNFSLDMHDEIMTLRGLGVFEAADVINMATTNGAQMAFPGRKLGQLQTGYEASFVAYFSPLPGNWAALREPVLGMRMGQVLLDKTNWLGKICSGK
jgi:hypothetical protein